MAPAGHVTGPEPSASREPVSRRRPEATGRPSAARSSGDLGVATRRLDVTTGAITALVDRLAERGHLVREPHPADRRRLEIHVTPHARDEVLRHILPLTADIRGLAETFDDGQRAAIGRFLDELTAIVQRHADDDIAPE